MFVIKTDRPCTDTSLPILKRDSLLEGANDGVKWLFDAASKYSYPTQAAPANGALARNLDESGNNGSITVQSGDAVGYAGGGLSFDGTTKVGTCLTGTAAAVASIWGSANQYFIVCLYLKLPTSGNWNSAGTLHDIFKTAGVDYTAGPDLLLIAQQSSSSSFSFRRQKAAASVDAITLVPAAGDYGSFVQIAFWRDATGQHARLKSANGTILQSTTVSTNNTQDFSATVPQIGPAAGFKGTPAGSTMVTSQQNASKYRLYRAWIENLVVSGRSAATVLDADYARTVARGVFS